MTISLRPFVPGDEPAVDALLDEDSDPLLVAQLHPLHGPDRDGERWRRTLLAVTDLGRVVGAGTVARNRVHPDHLSAIVEVACDWRRRGVGSALLTAIRAAAGSGASLRGRAHESDSAGLGFCAAAGAVPRVRCPGLGFTAPYDDLLQWSRHQQVPAGARVESLAALSEEELLNAWIELYVGMHADWSPAAPPPVLRGVFTDIVGDIRAELSAGAWVGDRLAAAAFVLTESPSLVTVVAETIRPDQPDGRALLAAALARCFEQVSAAGIAEMQLDGHDVDRHLAPIADGLPASYRNPLLLLELN